MLGVRPCDGDFAGVATLAGVVYFERGLVHFTGVWDFAGVGDFDRGVAFAGVGDFERGVVDYLGVGDFAAFDSGV